ncbi:MAG: hypothetical protein H6742_16140 [Alphaproteobacteria bacterium]|nr:hypothetical protein [Alphaproteobacteria bacterium]
MLTPWLLMLACAGGEDSAAPTTLAFGDEAGRTELPVSHGLWVDSRRLFACGGEPGIYILDITDAHTPERVDATLVPCGAIDGETGRVYSAAGDMGLQAFHPGSLTGIGEYTSDFPMMVLTSDPGEHRTYVAGLRPDPTGGPDDLLVVEGVATWQVESLAQHSRAELPAATPLAVAFDRQVVAVATDDGGITLLDERLETSTRLDAGGVAAGPTALAITDGTLWAALGDAGLVRIDDATATLQPVGGIDAATSVAAVGSRLYVGGPEELVILSLPGGTEVGRVALEGLASPSGIWVEQGLAYVADGADGALVVVVIDEGLR